MSYVKFILYNVLCIVGVYLSLNGLVIANNSDIFQGFTIIGDRDDEALLCFTDLHQFGNHNESERHIGRWYFPNGSAAGTSGDIYMSRDHGVVRLHRRNDVVMPTGVYHCQISDSTLIKHDLYVRLYSYGFEVSRSSSGALVGVVVVVSGVLLIVAGVAATIILCRVRKYRQHKQSCVQYTETTNAIQMEQNKIYSLNAELKINENTSYAAAPWRDSGSNQGPTGDNGPSEDSMHIYEHIMQ